MTISESAKKKLSTLLSEGDRGLAVTGFVGSCRGSAPVLYPTLEAQPNQKTFECDGITFFVNSEIADDFCNSSIHYDGSFFGKGLTITWPHGAGCACRS